MEESEMGIHQLKLVLRKELKARLKSMSQEEVVKKSKVINQNVLQDPHYKDASRVAVYLSLPEEVQTNDVIKDIFDSGKECFIPRYTKEDMQMVKLHSLEDLARLPMTNWKIKQPALDEEREDALARGGVDLVLAPGLGFTVSGERLGRGKGYYDRYLHALAELRSFHGLPPTYVIGLAFSEQILSHIPTSPVDFVLHSILYS